MYTKFQAGGSYKIYIETAAAKAVHDAYVSGIKSGRSKEAVIESMAAVMEGQVKRGAYLSRHMRDTAVDFRTYNLTTAQKNELEAACEKNGAKVILDEDHPPHLHVQF